MDIQNNINSHRGVASLAVTNGCMSGVTGSPEAHKKVSSSAEILISPHAPPPDSSVDFGHLGAPTVRLTRLKTRDLPAPRGATYSASSIPSCKHWPISFRMDIGTQMPTTGIYPRTRLAVPLTGRFRMRSNRIAHYRSQGSALTEALIAIIALSPGISFLVSFQGTRTFNSNYAKARRAAENLAERTLEEWRNFESLSSFSPIASGSDICSGSDTYTRSWTVTTAPTYKVAAIPATWPDKTGQVTANTTLKMNTIIARVDPTQTACNVSTTTTSMASMSTTSTTTASTTPATTTTAGRYTITISGSFTNRSSGIQVEDVAISSGTCIYSDPSYSCTTGPIPTG